MKKIAVLLTTFNCVEFLGKQVYTILNQIDVNITLYVSDDHSSDGTFEYLKQLSESDSRVVVLPKIARMGSAGKNFYRLVCDVDISIFDYVAFADQDDIWNLDKLSRHVNLIKAENAECVSSNVMAFWPDGTQKLIRKSQPQKSHDFIFEAAGPGCSFLMTPWLVNKLREEIQSPNSPAKNVELHDWITYAICRSSKRKWVIDAVPSLMYRQHLNNVFGANSGFSALFARLKKMRQGWYRSEVIKISQVCKSISSDDMYSFILACLQNKSYFSTLRLLPYVKFFRRKSIDRLALAAVIIFGLF